MSAACEECKGRGFFVAPVTGVAAGVCRVCKGGGHTYAASPKPDERDRDDSENRQDGPR